jgi:hypothetical protein
VVGDITQSGSQPVVDLRHQAVSDDHVEYDDDADVSRTNEQAGNEGHSGGVGQIMAAAFASRHSATIL